MRLGLSSLLVLLLAACPKAGSTPKNPTPDPAPEEKAPEESSLPIVDPSIVCADEGVTAFVFQLAWPDGCGGPANEFMDASSYAPPAEVEVQHQEPGETMSYAGPYDLGAKVLAFERAGCAGRVDLGGLVITFAANGDDNALNVTARWDAGDGTRTCDIPATGHYSSWQ
jgi:hypothetical protein